MGNAPHRENGESDVEDVGPSCLALHERLLVALLAFGMGVWCRTLRFRLGPEVQALVDDPPPPSVVILWHNRLFAAPELFRRHFRRRRLAALISASRDGAWLAAFLHRLRIRPVRGSRYRRGPQAFRELLEAHGGGFDLVVTPDGSRGPCYDMKPGAVAAARRCNAPLLLLSLRIRRGLRLRSWDGFYLPLPWSRIDVSVKRVDVARLEGTDKELARSLKAEMDALTEDLPSRRPATR